MDYYSSMRADFIHQEMYPDKRVDFVPKGPIDGPAYTIKPKPECVPKFTIKIEGNAVEEGARVFFEGIVDAQPKPEFSWYFNDEAIHPGTGGWEDAEIHDSRKMSTLIIGYAREHHMGKYTLVAQNRKGHAISNCDLIVRKKQFPPVFWQRLYNYEASSGTRLVAEVEVGGWPVPEVTWFKDGEELVSKTHTENWNGYPNKYVPEASLEVVQLDAIRHCVIFHRICESDSGLYTVRAVNALGEAICEGEIEVEPGMGEDSDLYLPEKWRHGNRLTWAMEDQRKKKFVGVEEPELSDEDIREMTKRVASAPLPRALEYLASLPDYYPAPMEDLPSMKYSGDPSEFKRGKKGGKPTRPSKFVKSTYQHSGHSADSGDGKGFRILPKWCDPRDHEGLARVAAMRYSPYHVEFPERDPSRSLRPEDPKGPPAPHEWESHETVDELYRLLDTVGCRMMINTSSSKSSAVNLEMNQSTTVERKLSGGSTMGPTSQKAVVKNSKGNVKKFSYLAPSKASESDEWKRKLEANKAASMTTAEAFTKQFVHHDLEQQSLQQQEFVQSTTTTTSSSSKKEVTFAEGHQEFFEPSVEPPVLPPKTKIMNSPSRHLFSPTEELDCAASVTSSHQSEEFVSVKDKIKIIAAQQEEIVRREESKTTKRKEHAPPAGGIRILPPSPTTVRKEAEIEAEEQSKQQNHLQQLHEQHQTRQQLQQLQQQQLEQQQHLMRQQHQLEQQQKQQQVLTSASATSVTSASSAEFMYDAQVSAARETAFDQTEAMMMSTGTLAMIPRLEDKYESSTVQQSSFSSQQQSFSSSNSASHHQSISSSSTTSQQQFQSSSVQQSSSSHFSSSFEQKQEKSSTSATAVETGPPMVAMPSQDMAPRLQHSNEIEERELETKEPKAVNTQRSPEHNTTLKEQQARTDSQSHQHHPKSETNFLKQKFVPSESPTPTNSPFVARRGLRVNQSPVTVGGSSDQELPVKYRTPPSTPFQPGFYKVPDADGPDHESPMYKLPDKKLKTSLDRKLRRKKRAEKLASDHGASDDSGAEELDGSSIVSDQQRPSQN